MNPPIVRGQPWRIWEEQARRLDRARRIEKELRRLCDEAGIGKADDPNLVLIGPHREQALKLAREWMKLQQQFWAAPVHE